MDIIKLKNLLKENKYILIDYSEKFKMNIELARIKNDKKYENMIMLKICNIYMEMDNKLNDDKYNNLVFLLDISKIKRYNCVFFKMLFEWGEIPLADDILYIKNSDNFMWFKNGEEIKDNIIINFLNQKNNKLECNVCFEEYGLWVDGLSNNGTYCGVCNFRTCYKCCIKAKENNISGTCFGCRTEQTNEYTMCK
jgi:hypothetical protein